MLVAAQDRRGRRGGRARSARSRLAAGMMSSSASTSSSIARAAPQRLLRPGRVAVLERGGGLLERVPELADHRLRDAVDHQDGIGREQQRRDRERDAADQPLERTRSTMKAESACGSAASRIADTAASLTSTSPPQQRERRGHGEHDQQPGPGAGRCRSGTAARRRTAHAEHGTPPTSSNAWRRRWARARQADDRGDRRDAGRGAARRGVPRGDAPRSRSGARCSGWGGGERSTLFASAGREDT